MPPKKIKRVAPVSSVAVVTVSIINPRDEFDEEDRDEEEWDGVGCPCGGHDYSAIRCFNAAVNLDGVKVGSISAYIIDRPTKRFHAVCEGEESQELEDVGFSFFGWQGAPRFAGFKSDEDTHEGGFLFISEFRVSAETERAAERAMNQTDLHTEVPFLALERFFELPGIDGCWTACVYCCNPESTTRGDEAAAAHTARSFSVDRAADARHFLRAGFSEAEGHPDHLYLTSTMHTSKEPLSHEEALAAPLLMAAVPESAEPLSVENEELRQTVLSFFDENLPAGENKGRGARTPNALLRQVDKHVAAGADLNRAHVLHCAAANDLPVAVLTGLVNRGADVNHLDFEGMTALMMAAKPVANKATRLKRWDTSLLKCLLDLGADKKLVDKRGKTALGHLYATNRHNNDVLVCFRQINKMIPVDLRCDKLLTYCGNLSPGDKEAACDGKYEGEDMSLRFWGYLDQGDLCCHIDDSPHECDRLLPAYFRIEPVQVSKPCTECGHKFSKPTTVVGDEDECCFLDVSKSRGADLLCCDCMARKLGYVYCQYAPDSDFDEFNYDDDEDADDEERIAAEARAEEEKLEAIAEERRLAVLEEKNAQVEAKGRAEAARLLIIQTKAEEVRRVEVVAFQRQRTEVAEMKKADKEAADLVKAAMQAAAKARKEEKLLEKEAKAAEKAKKEEGKQLEKEASAAEKAKKGENKRLEKETMAVEKAKKVENKRLEKEAAAIEKAQNEEVKRLEKEVAAVEKAKKEEDKRLEKQAAAVEKAKKEENKRLEKKTAAFEKAKKEEDKRLEKETAAVEKAKKEEDKRLEKETTAFEKAIKEEELRQEKEANNTEKAKKDEDKNLFQAAKAAEKALLVQVQPEVEAARAEMKALEAETQVHHEEAQHLRVDEPGASAGAEDRACF